MVREGFDLTPDGKELWVANAQDKTISIIDLASKKVVDTLPSTGNANRLKLTRGRQVRVRFRPGRNRFADHRRGDAKAVQDDQMGASTEGLVMSPDGTHAYTTLNDHDSVAAIDLKTFEVTGEVKTGRQAGRTGVGVARVVIGFRVTADHGDCGSWDRGHGPRSFSIPRPQTSQFRFPPRLHHRCRLQDSRRTIARFSSIATRSGSRLSACTRPYKVVPAGNERPSPFSVICISLVISSSEAPVHYYSSLGKFSPGF